MFKRFLNRLAIRILENDLLVPTAKEILTEAQANGLLASLWDNPAFRNYIADRNAKLVYSIAGLAGDEPEPRDKTRLMVGQRVENLLLASKAKSCAVKRNEELQAKKEKQEEVAES